MTVNKKNTLALWLTAGSLALAETSRLLKDIHQSSRTYKFIHHRSQKKLRRLARQRS